MSALSRREGTFDAAADRLDHLAALGVTAVEIMPVAQFAGNRGWGYDGVLLYAPHNAYGTPDDLRRLVDTAHAKGLMVLLDVVYNHFGPEGNYLGAYAPDFFHPERHTPWGAAIAYERAPVRDFMIGNALYWLKEFRFDGLRLDAIDNIRDEDSDEELLVEMARRIRADITDRPVHLTTEDNRNITRLHERGKDGSVPLYTGEWNDDFHNAAHVVATGEADAYYADFARDHWRKLARSLAEGFAFQGEAKLVGDRPRRAERATCRRRPSSTSCRTTTRSATAPSANAWSISPTRGWCARWPSSCCCRRISRCSSWARNGARRNPFAFFTDFHGDLAEAVRKGRRKEFARFAAFRDPQRRAAIPDPNAPATFEASKIDWDRIQAGSGRDWLAFYRGSARNPASRDHPAPGRHGCELRSRRSKPTTASSRSTGALPVRRCGCAPTCGPSPHRTHPAAGRIIYAHPAATAGSGLPPFSVVFRLDEDNPADR